ncbi:hypothetical protein A8F09_11180 [Burkholderia cenocepacia]|nr:hypothetical protein A8E48_09035 [Burkholderia cenocepacia]ONX07820.1 hypothetical protein A8F09_11180 [Burkholderia cenocepacia]ONX29267.1 hypothetical protein A8F06_08040 [Burkholderia cenocepacia]
MRLRCGSGWTDDAAHAEAGRPGSPCGVPGAGCRVPGAGCRVPRAKSRVPRVRQSHRAPPLLRKMPVFLAQASHRSVHFARRVCASGSAMPK